jgi:Flp pilus assembly protein TadD
VIFKAILDAKPTPVVRLNPEVPAELERIIDKALEKDRDLRYQSAAEMRSDLQRLRRDTESHKLSAVTHAPSAVPARRLRWMVGAALILIAAAASVYFFDRPAPKLTEKDTIVLADFTNITGDPVFDGTLRQGLSAQLEQSPFLSLISDQRISQTLALMSQPKDSRLTRALGREVCQRTASAAMIEGSVASLGNQYVLGLSAINCQNGDILAQEQVTANGKESVIKALGEAATKLRQSLGESLASVQKYDVPLADVTTPSLEALHAYSVGRQSANEGDWSGAASSYQRAISLDSNFAMAYVKLGLMYYNLNESSGAANSIRRAYELRWRTSEREQLAISAYYDGSVTGNLERACTADELWTRTYPHDAEPLIDLTANYVQLGKFEKSVEAGRKAVKLDPANTVIYSNLANGYMKLDHLSETRRTLREQEVHTPGSHRAHIILYFSDFLEHDLAGMDHEAAGLVGKPGWDDYILYLESYTAEYGGEFVKARELARRATDSAQRAEQKETAALYQADAAVKEALVGYGALAKQGALTALALATGREVEGISAIALGLAGDFAQATRLAGDLGRRFPEDTIVQFRYLPAIRAAVAIRSSRAGNAVEALAAATPYEMGAPYSLYPAYLRGEAYLAESQGVAATLEFQKILDHPGVVANDPIGALAHLGLGRAYALAGDNAKAKTAYQDFLTLWKNADPDIPILIQAKAEYAKLN